MGGVTRTGVVIAMVPRRWCHIYRKRSPSKYNGSCPNARDILLGLWWHNTLTCVNPYTSWRGLYQVFHEEVDGGDMLGGLVPPVEFCYKSLHNFDSL